MTNTLNIELRTETGKGEARSLRRAGKTPAIIYGAKGETKVALQTRELALTYAKGGFLTTVFELTDGKNKFQVLPREVQLHPVKDSPLHADFLQVEDNTEVKVKIKVNYNNRENCPALKKGGILSIVRHKVELLCAASKIPAALEVDLDGYNVGDSVHISAVTLPEGVRPTIEGRDFTLATLAGRAAEEVIPDGAPVAEGEEGEEGEEGAEGEAAEGGKE